MALAQKLGVDLVSPVEVLKKIEMSLAPGGAIDSELVRCVVDKLTVLGFGVFTTPRTPFHLMARESEDRLLATAFERYRNLREHVDVISRLSRVVDITTFLVSHEKEGAEKLRGIPIIQEDELAEIEKRSDLSGIIKEKRQA
jgi:predicted transcriptional regulator